MVTRCFFFASVTYRVPCHAIGHQKDYRESSGVFYLALPPAFWGFPAADSLTSKLARFYVAVQNVVKGLQRFKIFIVKPFKCIYILNDMNELKSHLLLILNKHNSICCNPASTRRLGDVPWGSPIGPNVRKPIGKLQGTLKGPIQKLMI